MYRTATVMAALAFSALGATRGPRPSTQFPQEIRPHLKEERVTLVYTATANEATVVFEAESEAQLERIHVRGPGGRSLLSLGTERGRGMALAGFVIETSETGPAGLFQTYPEGIYDLRAWTVDGVRLTGNAEFTHELPAAPIVLHPLEGDAGVPAGQLTVSWVPDPGVARYKVIMEQDENDGLQVELPAGSDSFQVPPGVLAPGEETVLEVGAIGRNGNTTLVEVRFTTR